MPRHPVRRAFGLLSGLLLIVFTLVFAASLVSVRSRHGLGAIGGGGTVAIVPLEGEITSSDEFVDTLKDLGERTGIRGVVVRINSPGGAVAPSQEMYEAIRSLRDKKPVIASLGSVAASGGYYVASAADVIVASPGTLTGSIGVILQLANVSSLLDKLGVQATVVKAGKHKDVGSPFRQITPEEQALLQGMVDQVHTQFIDAVAAGRKMDQERARSLADGRIFSGQQAKELGLVDELGGLQEAVRIVATRAGIEGEPKIERVSPRRAPWWWRLVFSDRVPVGPATAGALGLVEDALAGVADGSSTRPLWRLPVATQGFQW
jgi:protease-4